jgi:tight adherence protein B
MPPPILLTFAGVFALVFGAYWFLVVVPEQRGRQVLRRRMRWENPVEANVDLLKKPEVFSTIGALNEALKRSANVIGPLKQSIDQSGLPITVGAFILVTVASALAGFVVVALYTRVIWIAVLAAFVPAIAPYVFVRFKRTRRIRLFEEQFPEAIQLIARSMRAGHAFSTGLKMASDEVPAPCGTEFRALYEQQNYGAQLPDALRGFAERIPSLDARFFVTAVLTQREAGGNLSEVLDRLASVMRERFRIKREVRVKSAHGRMTAFVLAAMPPALALILLINNPEALQLLISDPLGIRMIMGALVLEVVGTLIVRKLADVEY